MKIAISAMGTDLDAQVDPRFGRCQYFIIMDPDTLEFEAVENPNVSATGGAGIQSAQMIAEKGVQVILTGNVGPNAFQTLSSAGIQVITGITGTVKEVIQRFKSGQFQPVGEPTVPGHFGMGGVPGAGPGMGRGMGRGAGMGRGMGRWGAMRQGMPFGFPPQQQMPNQELQMLKEQAKIIKQQLDQITKRISELEKK